MTDRPAGGAPPDPPRGTWPERGSDRYLGGVASGMAGVFDIDPFVVRVALVLLAVYFPIVIVLYTLAWLLLRDQRTHRSLLAGRHEPDGWRPLVGVSALGIGAAVLAPELGPNGDGEVKVGLVLLAVGLMLVMSRSRRSPDDEPAGGEGPEADDGADVSAPPPAGPPLVHWPSRVSRPRRPPSYLGWFGLSALVVLIGILAGVDQGIEPLEPGVAVSLCLLLVGAVLLVAAWRGRARVLLPAGVLLLPLWVGFAVTDVPRYETDGGKTYRFGADDPFPTKLTHGYGRMEVDLSEADFDEGQERRLRLGLTSGHLRIDVPREVHLRIQGDVGFGMVNINDHWHVRDEGPLFPGGVDMAMGDPDDFCEKIVHYPDEFGLNPGDPGYPEDLAEYEGETLYPGDPRYPAPLGATTTTSIEYWDAGTGTECEPAKPSESPAELALVLDVGIGGVEVNRV